jgi:LysM repeat protein
LQFLIDKLRIFTSMCRAVESARLRLASSFGTRALRFTLAPIISSFAAIALRRTLAPVKLVLLCLVLFYTFKVEGQNKKYTAAEYISMYKGLAVSEMRRTGIPASITLAQGLLESAVGNSKLAKEANNHFGIKCKKNWPGRTFHTDDDAPQECFRVYDKAEDSYKDHSEFILAGKRYAFLFDLDPKDYKGWAAGLKAAGYATNPHYPDLLINSIENYKLYELDEARPSGTKADTAHFAFNGIPAYVLKQGESVESVAKAHNMSPWQLRKYNDLVESDVVEPGTVLYMKPKRRRGTQEYYTIREGEDMYFVSQLFRIKLKQLYKKNRLPSGSEPKPGELIYLKSKRDTAPQVLPGSAAASMKKKGINIRPVKIGPEPYVEAENPKQNDSLLKALAAKHIRPLLQPVDTTLKSRLEETLRRLDEELKAGNNAPRVRYDSLARKMRAEKKEVSATKANQGGDSIFTKKESTAVVPNDAIVKPSVVVRPEQKNDTLDTKGLKIKATTLKNTEPALVERTEYNPLIDSANGKYHRVQKGETLYSISKKYHVNIDSLKAWNNIDGNSMHLNRRLKMTGGNKKETKPSLPKSTPEPLYHIVEKGESLFSIAKKYSISVNKLKEWNELENEGIKKGQKLRVK